MMTSYWSRHLCENISFTQKCSWIWAEYFSDISEVCCNFLSHIHLLLWSESYMNKAAVVVKLFCFEHCLCGTLKHSLYIWCWRCLNVLLIFYYFMMWLALLMVCYVLNSAVFVSDIFLVSCSVGKTYIPYILFFPIYLRSFWVANEFSHLLQVHTFFLHNPKDFSGT